MNLDKVEKSEQMARYFGYANLILTNGLEFRFFKNGKRYGDASVLATKQGETIEAKPDAFGPFERQVAAFIEESADTIRSAQHLAQIMGGKAARLRDNIADMLRPDYGGTKGIEIEKIRDILKGKLIHDLADEQFADLYAQTLVYGLFVARYHDDTPETFSRGEARDKIPASNPLLQEFFNHIAGPKFEKKLLHIVDELCEVFRHADVHALVHGIYLKDGDTHDPIIHFYEDFLREYDPKQRSQRGVFYTPLPVVRYIVRSVDALLKEHFGLKDGLADRATVEWEHTVQGKKAKQTIDRVQILDPAVGTGTFLNEVIRHIHGTFKGQEGSWPKFVEEHLLQRLNGFELMMASYTIAHLKLNMTLAETGVKETRKRLRVFLTNSLEEAPEKDDSLFQFIGLQGALTEESQLAAEVKRDLPIMVVLGNPPYSGHSANKGEWIERLLDAYKQEPEGGNLQERNSKWLNDDYVKFIRVAQHLISKAGDGIVAFITNHSYLDNPTFRGMRWNLMQSFDDIYIVDLHGNSKKKEIAPNGTSDANVFDIQQGVAIFIAVKHKQQQKGSCQIKTYNLFGSREHKYDWLANNSVTTTEFAVVSNGGPDYNFVVRDQQMWKEYEQYNNVITVLPTNTMGFQTHRDEFAIAESREAMMSRMNEAIDEGVSDSAFGQHFNLTESSTWKIQAQRAVIRKAEWQSLVAACAYRPFDSRWCVMHSSFNDRPRKELVRNMTNKKNLAIVIGRQGQVVGSHLWNLVWCATNAVDANIFYRGGGNVFPLYLYPDSATVSGEQRTANLDMKLLTPALKKLKLEWVTDGVGDGKKTCGPEDIFDYIYAVLHSPSYRTRYKEFLKIDFPRVPFTANAALFWQLVKLGREVRRLHLLESPALSTLRTSYPVAGTDVVEKIRFEASPHPSRLPEGEVETGKVWINPTQYFGEVSKVAWEFFIGGYQPAQKWLKDRKGRTLSSDDTLHYQKIIVALCETDRLMKEIDVAIAENGGFPMK